MKTLVGAARFELATPCAQGTLLRDGVVSECRVHLTPERLYRLEGPGDVLPVRKQQIVVAGCHGEVGQRGNCVLLLLQKRRVVEGEPQRFTDIVREGILNPVRSEEGFQKLLRSLLNVESDHVDRTALMQKDSS